ncbi:hypothetical protein [Mycoplasma leonicaptivi]|uniref:hypothetical protein n=1 Tax=Mycoplasma leonicaptivi TaxID=36742 RepID=UPI000686BD1D|nr:hypothetical protein [Mycoplasma leonicaptivi]
MIKNLYNTIYFSQISTSAPNADIQNYSPTTLIIVAVLFLVLALVFLILYKYSLNKMRIFKDKQLQAYKKDNPKKINVTYESSGLYLPAWERAKYNLPLFLSVTFLSIAIVFFVWASQLS